MIWRIGRHWKICDRFFHHVCSTNPLGRETDSVGFSAGQVQLKLRRNQILLYDVYNVTPKTFGLNHLRTIRKLLLAPSQLLFSLKRTISLFIAAVRCILLILPNSLEQGQCTAHYVGEPVCSARGSALFSWHRCKKVYRATTAPERHCSARGTYTYPRLFLLTNYTLLATPLLGPLTYIQYTTRDSLLRWTGRKTKTKKHRNIRGT